MPAWFIHRYKPIVATALVVWALGLAGFVTLVVTYDLDFLGPVGGPWVVSFATFAITGALIAWQRPEHVMGPLFLLLGITPALSNTMAAAALGVFANHPLELTRSLFAAVGVAVSTAYFPLLPLVIVAFPDGKLPSPRWRWLWLACAVASLVGAATAFLTGAWGGDTAQTLVGPPFDGMPATVGRALSPVFHTLILALLAAGGVAIVLRHRRSDATVRRQIRWLVLAVILLVLLSGGVILFEFIQRTSATAAMVIALSVGITLVPVSVTIAILRNRLFDIDLVLNRTLVFGLLAAFVTLMYVAIVVGVGTFLGDPSNLGLTVGATAAVAAAFEPVRARIQHWANVAVFGRRATPYEVLSTITGELGGVGRNDDQLESMAALLADGAAAEHTTMWIATGDELHATACWPAHDPDDHAPLAIHDAESSFAEPSRHLEPVVQDGHLIGALSLERERGDPLTPRDHRLIVELAGQASLVIGNARLRADLRARVEDLRASRTRLVATLDEARRRLERDLHDGAQQQLVALKVKLGLARALAVKEDADDEVMHGLDELSVTADEAVDGLRSVARGIYPPLLEAEGLERAIVAQARGASIPVSVRAVDLERYDRDIEATVYFCVIEGLGNTVQHADASTLDVLLEDRGEQISFTLVDDGRGFDDAGSTGLGLRNMADRVDALGGSLTVTTSGGAGVRIHGTIPLGGCTPDDASPATAPAASRDPVARLVVNRAEPSAGALTRRR